MNVDFFGMYVIKLKLRKTTCSHGIQTFVKFKICICIGAKKASLKFVNTPHTKLPDFAQR